MYIILLNWPTIYKKTKHANCCVIYFPRQVFSPKKNLQFSVYSFNCCGFWFYCFILWEDKKCEFDMNSNGFVASPTDDFFVYTFSCSQCLISAWKVSTDCSFSIKTMKYYEFNRNVWIKEVLSKRSVNKFELVPCLFWKRQTIWIDTHMNGKILCFLGDILLHNLQIRWNFWKIFCFAVNGMTPPTRFSHEIFVREYTIITLSDEWAHNARNMMYYYIVNVCELWL